MSSVNNLHRSFNAVRIFKVWTLIWCSLVLSLSAQNASAQDIVAGSSVIVLKARAKPAPKKEFGNTAAKNKKAAPPATASRAKNAKPPAAAKTSSAKTSDPAVRTVAAGVVNAQRANLPKPAYPRAAAMVKASGAVNVQVLIDENGDVISAEAVSGHPLLRAAAVNAAREAQFEPVVLRGQPVRVTGIIVYNFVK